MIIQVRGTGLAILFFLAAGMNAQKGRSACMKGGAACALIGCQRGDCLQFASPRLAAITFVDLLLPNLACAAPLPQVLPTQLVPDEKEGKILRVRLIMKEGKKLFDPVYLFDQVGA